MDEHARPFWRPGEPGGNGRIAFQAATVCRRGHVQNSGLTQAPTDLRRCPLCGADVLGCCQQCGLRIRGNYYVPRVVAPPDPVPPFCDGCGSAHPWATRKQRLYELQNILDQENVDDADRLWIDEQLDRLRQYSGDLTEKQEKEIWSGIKRRAPVLFRGTSATVVGTLISAGVKAALGLP